MPKFVLNPSYRAPKQQDLNEADLLEETLEQYGDDDDESNVALLT